MRRLPDTHGWFRTRRHYEVALFPPDSDEPVWVRATEHPGSVLTTQGVHTTDVHDYIAQADRAWDGGVGEWRSPFPSDDD